jgi:uncharacterized integral membrane protein
VITGDSLATRGVSVSEFGAGSNENPGDDRPSISPAAHDSGSEIRTPAPVEQEPEVFRHTRTSAAWVSITVIVVFGVALIDFIAQNTRDERIEFFGASGRIPIAVALLAAAVAGAIVVLAIGVGRVAQLRMTMRRERKRRHAQTDSQSSSRD